MVRLAANKLQLNSLPSWFWNLPKLSWLAIAGNIASDGNNNNNNNNNYNNNNYNSRNNNAHNKDQLSINTIDWTDLDIMEKLGEGASGIIYKAKWHSNNSSKKNLTSEEAPIDNNKIPENYDEIFVAVKLFKGGKTSDGLPEDEMKASEAAGKHYCSFEVLGRIKNAPNNQLGLVMPLIPKDYYVLGGPPSFTTVTRDTFDVDKKFKLEDMLRILTGISSVCAHLHKRGISHGDLYAHNILVNEAGACLLSDFGASSFYQRINTDDIGIATCCERDSVVGMISNAMERFEVRAFGCLTEDLLDRVADVCIDSYDTDIYSKALQDLSVLKSECTSLHLTARPTFLSINRKLVEITHSILKFTS